MCERVHSHTIHHYTFTCIAYVLCLIKKAKFFLSIFLFLYYCINSILIQYIYIYIYKNIYYYIIHTHIIYLYLSPNPAPTDNGTRAKDLLHLLRERYVFMPGGRDHRGGVTLVFPSHSGFSSTNSAHNCPPGHAPSSAAAAGAGANSSHNSSGSSHNCSTSSSTRHYTDLKNIVRYLLSLCRLVCQFDHNDMTMTI